MTQKSNVWGLDVVTSKGKDCFPKYTKQFLNHYYGMNEFFRGESQMKKKDEIKVCLVGSSGGHLTHLYMLKPFWKDKNRFWVTFDKEDARSLLEGEKVYPCYFPTNRSIKALIKNTKIAWDVLHKEKPDLIISCGAAVAVPFFYIGKMMGAKLVYIEVFDRIDKPTMTGKMVYVLTALSGLYSLEASLLENTFDPSNDETLPMRLESRLFDKKLKYYTNYVSCTD